MILNKYIKKIVILTLICIYSFAMVKTILPIANDFIAHTFYKMQHLATVHYENGKYYLHSELLANEHNSPAKNSSTVIVDESLAFHILVAVPMRLLFETSHSLFVSRDTSRWTFSFLEIQVPPPDNFS